MYYLKLKTQGHFIVNLPSRAYNRPKSRVRNLVLNTDKFLSCTRAAEKRFMLWVLYRNFLVLSEFNDHRFICLCYFCTLAVNRHLCSIYAVDKMIFFHNLQ